MKKLLILLFFALSTAAVASDSWPGWFKSRSHSTGQTNLNAGAGAGNGAVSVAEPGTLALLGVGLIPLGIYAKRKRGKKR